MVLVMTMFPLNKPAAILETKIEDTDVLKAKAIVLARMPTRPNSITGRRPMRSLMRPHMMLVPNWANEYTEKTSVTYLVASVSLRLGEANFTIEKR